MNFTEVLDTFHSKGDGEGFANCAILFTAISQGYHQKQTDQDVCTVACQSICMETGCLQIAYENSLCILIAIISGCQSVKDI